MQIGPCILQIEKTNWRATLAGCRVTVYQHLDGTWSIGYGPHVVGRYNREGLPLQFEVLSQHQSLGKRNSLRSSRFPRLNTTTQPQPQTKTGDRQNGDRGRDLEVDPLHDRRSWTISARNLSRKSTGEAENTSPADFRHSSRLGSPPSPKHQSLGKRGSLRSPRFPRPNTKPKPDTSYAMKTGLFNLLTTPRQ